MLWGPQGELPAASPHAPHHPPVLRRVAAASAVAGDPRRRLMARTTSHGHPQDLVVHHHHHHHYHYYTLAPRAQWGEYPPIAQRGMPALEQERDWEAPQPGRPTRARVRRRRVPTFMRWWGSRRADSRDDDSIDFSYEDLIELDARNVTRGLNADELGALETRVADSSCQECHICLEGVDEGEKIVKLKCGHEYHQSCIHTWLKLKRTCPICRCEL